MSEASTKTWKTKHGSRRVRQEEPTLDEAIAAARDLTDQLDAQVEIAAALIGLPEDQVRAAVMRLAATPKEPVRTFSVSRIAGPRRTVQVEYKRASRR